LGFLKSDVFDDTLEHYTWPTTVFQVPGSCFGSAMALMLHVFTSLSRFEVSVTLALLELQLVSLGLRAILSAMLTACVEGWGTDGLLTDGARFGWKKQPSRITKLGLFSYPTEGGAFRESVD